MVVNIINVGEFSEQEIQDAEEKSNFSESITQNWTEQALECYHLNCDCSKCSIAQGGYSFECQMPKVLDALISTLGKPASKTNLTRIK